ncbi:MAG: hypothetical protein CVU02_03540, partial [Bacteroidetes bacterium HGW-Bacteroidetes-19]
SEKVLVNKIASISLFEYCKFFIFKPNTFHTFSEQYIFQIQKQFRCGACSVAKFFDLHIEHCNTAIRFHCSLFIFHSSLFSATLARLV